MAEYPDFEKTCGYGSVTGIGGANCRHSFWPFIEGVSERTYTDEQLRHIDDGLGCEFEGRRYSAYQASQMQRRIEREMRRQQRRKTAFDAAGLSGDATAAGVKLRRLNEKYRQFSAAAGLPQQRERLKVSYADKTPAKAAAPLDTPAKSGIMGDVGYQDIPITDEAIQRVPLIQPDGWSAAQAQRLQEAHRVLLRAVQDKPVGTEAGAIYSTDMRLIERRIGESADYQIAMPRYSEPHILIHNHPSGEIFSVRDLDSFFYNTDMTGMTVVGNGGNTYAILKSDQYDGFRFGMKYLGILDRLEDAQKSNDMDGYIRIIIDMLKEASDCGLEFIEG